MRKLEGGFINEVFLEEDIVVKTFTNDSLVGVPSMQRIENEAMALSIFGGKLAPRLLDKKDRTLCQEFIRGESYEARARRGERVFFRAGFILADIHLTLCFNGNLNSHYLGRFQKALHIASPILKAENISPVFDVDWSVVDKIGARYIHGDFWLGNLIGYGDDKPRAIDWEFSGVGSPYEDFAIADLWIFREFPSSEDDFWRGYGRVPDRQTVNSFLALRCVEFLATTTSEQYALEESEGFYHNKIKVLKSLFE